MVGLRQAAGGVVRRGVLVARDRFLSTGIHVRNPDYCVWKTLRSISRTFQVRQHWSAGAVWNVAFKAESQSIHFPGNRFDELQQPENSHSPAADPLVRVCPRLP